MQQLQLSTWTEAGMELVLAGALASNFVFGVAIVICNKAVVALDGFNFIVVLTLCHFLFTLFACTIMAKGRIFVPKHLPWTHRMYLSSVGTFGCLDAQHFSPVSQQQPVRANMATASPP